MLAAVVRCVTFFSKAAFFTGAYFPVRFVGAGRADVDIFDRIGFVVDGVGISFVFPLAEAVACRKRFCLGSAAALAGVDCLAAAAFCGNALCFATVPGVAGGVQSLLLLLTATGA